MLIMAGVLGVVGLIVSIVGGHYIAGLAFLAGLVLGWVNAMMTVASAAKFARSNNPAKGPVAISTLKRLAGFTAVALAAAFLLRPDGVGVIIGLALFQMMMVGNTSRGLLAELRRNQT